MNIKENAKEFGKGIKDLVTDKQGLMFAAGFVASAAFGGGFFYAMGLNLGAYLAVSFYSIIIAGTSIITGRKLAIDNRDNSKIRKAGTAFASLAIAGIFTTVAIKPFSDGYKQLNENLKANAIAEEKRKAAIEENNTIKIDCSGKFNDKSGVSIVEAGREIKVELPNGCAVVRKLKVEGCCK